MKIYCLMLDLKDDPALIEEYKRYHQPDGIWPEVISAIRSSGILNQQIFLLGTRMIMVLQTPDDFCFEHKAELDRNNPLMQAWEDLMNRFQQPVPQARSGEKWVLMEKIFEA